VRFAERRVARAKKACEAGVEKLAAIEKSLAERAEEKLLEDVELQEAEVAYQNAAKALQPEVEQGPQTVGGLASLCVGLSDEFFGRAQTTRELMANFCAMAVAEHAANEKKLQEKDAAEAAAKLELAKGQKAAETAAAAVAEELERTKAELATLRGETAKTAADALLADNASADAPDLSYAASVDAIMGDLLGAAGLDANLKRDVEAKLEVLNKRRKT
jgi:hypothetical protein